MIISPIIRNEFALKEPFIEILAKNVREIIFNYCSTNGFAFIDRIKTLESLSEKIETGRFKNWSDMDDFYAASIIIPNLNEESKVIAFLRSVFNEVQLRKRGKTQKSPDVFRFDNTRFIGKLKQSGEVTLLSKINFEIQIKTAFEHAWSTSTHSLVYKANEIDWKLLRIAAQLKSSVEQLDMIVSSAKHLNSHIIEHDWPEIKVKKKILELTNEFLTNPNVPDELKPKDSSRFAENLFAFYSHLVKNNKNSLVNIKPFFQEANKTANSLGLEKFPRSISLMQYFIGVSLKLGFNQFEKYTPLITTELESIFPETKIVETRFAI